MCDESSSSDSDVLLSQEKSPIDVKVDVHAEMNSEPILHSPNSAHSIPFDLKPKILLKEICSDCDEIFSIRDEISWRIISKDIDYYRINENKPQTTDSSDTEQDADMNDISLPNPSKAEYSAMDVSQSSKRPARRAILIQRPMVVIPINRRQRNESKKRAYVSGNEKCHSKRRKQSIFSDDSDGENMQKENLPDQEESTWQTASPIICQENKSKYTKYDRNPLSEANKGDEMFDTILSTETYEMGQLTHIPKFSYRQYSKSYTKTSPTSPSVCSTLQDKRTSEKF